MLLPAPSASVPGHGEAPSLSGETGERPGLMLYCDVLGGRICGVGLVTVRRNSGVWVVRGVEPVPSVLRRANVFLYVSVC